MFGLPKHLQDMVHGTPALPQEQFLRHRPVLHLHIVGLTHGGFPSLVILTSTRQESTVFRPYPTGQGISLSDPCAHLKIAS